MGASIYWEPVKSKKKSINTASPETFWRHIEKALELNDRNELKLDKEHLQLIKGMCVTQSSPENPYQQLIDLIEKYGEIIITKEY